MLQLSALSQVPGTGGPGDLTVLLIYSCDQSLWFFPLVLHRFSCLASLLLTLTRPLLNRSSSFCLLLPLFWFTQLRVGEKRALESPLSGLLLSPEQKQSRSLSPRPVPSADTVQNESQLFVSAKPSHMLGLITALPLSTNYSCPFPRPQRGVLALWPREELIAGSLEVLQGLELQKIRYQIFQTAFVGAEPLQSLHSCFKVSRECPCLSGQLCAL